MTEFQPQPPSTDTCSFCGRPIGWKHNRVNGRPACEQCTQRLAQMAELNEFRAGPWMLGAIYGLAAAIVCGFAWALVTKITHAEIGIIAIGVGIGVTRSIIAGANGRRGTSIQWLAVILSLVGIFIGKGLIASWVYWDEMTKDLTELRSNLLLRAKIFFEAPIRHPQLFDLVWYAIAGYQAWRMTRPIQIRIELPQGFEQQGFRGEMSSPSFRPPPAVQQSPSRPPSTPPSPRSTPLSKAIPITLVSAAISAMVYAGGDGWPFAIGSVLCILIHEMGHTVACLLYGLPASSPIFIPYVGAVINLRAEPPNAKVESIIGIAGPWGGLLAAVVCFIWYRATHSELAGMLVQFGAMINLFNLLPLHPLDGGRIARGVAKGFWPSFVLLFAAFIWYAPLIGIRREVAGMLGVISLFGIARTIQKRVGAYYDISGLAEWSIGFAYLATAAVLLWLWWESRGVGSIF